MVIRVGSSNPSSSYRSRIEGYMSIYGNKGREFESQLVLKICQGCTGAAVIDGKSSLGEEENGIKALEYLVSRLVDHHYDIHFESRQALEDLELGSEVRDKEDVESVFRTTSSIFSNSHTFIKESEDVESNPEVGSSKNRI